MKRFHEETHIMAARKRLNEAQEHHRVNPAGRYRKRKPFDCGNARCGVCHGHKRFGHEDTRQEKVARLRHSEQQQEVARW